jgi:hypothetical protein
MPFGRKSKPVKIQNIGPTVRQTRVMDGLGNASTSQVGPGGRLITQAQLSPQQRAIGQLGQQALVRLTQELGQGSAYDYRTANRLSQSSYKALSNTINQESNVQRDRLRGELSQRFGGSTASTFGNDLLARQESARLNNLSLARQESLETGQRALQQLQTARIQRINVLGQLVEGTSRLSNTLNTSASRLFQTERSRRQSRSLAIAQLRQQNNQANVKFKNDQTKMYLDLLGNIGRGAGKP